MSLRADYARGNVGSHHKCCERMRKDLLYVTGKNTPEEMSTHTIHAADGYVLYMRLTPCTGQTSPSQVHSVQTEPHQTFGRSPGGSDGNPNKLRAEPRRSRRTRPSKIEAVSFFHKKVIRMKKFKPKSVKWNARVRMYAVDHTYEERILPPHGCVRASRLGSALSVRWATPRWGCLTCT